MSKESIKALAQAGIHIEDPKIIVADDSVEIELVTENVDLAKLAADEKFMADELVIRLGTTTDENARPYATVTINGPQNRANIPRGIPVRIKRMYVEVLARMKETRYKQITNPMDPEAGNELHPNHAQAYNFEVLKDPSPIGAEWLDRILNEPAY